MTTTQVRSHLDYGDKPLPSLLSGTYGRTLKPTEAAGLWNRILGKQMRWICDESGVTYSYPITEPMNKPVYCVGCGKNHLLTPGELDAQDLLMIKRIKEAAYEDDDTLYMCDAATRRVSERGVMFMSMTDRFASGWDRPGESMGPVAGRGNI